MYKINITRLAELEILYSPKKLAGNIDISTPISRNAINDMVVIVTNNISDTTSIAFQTLKSLGVLEQIPKEEKNPQQLNS